MPGWVMMVVVMWGGAGGGAVGPSLVRRNVDRGFVFGCFGEYCMFMRVRRVLHVHVPSHAPATGQTLSIRTASLLRSRDDLPQPQIMTLPSSRKVNVKCSWQCMRVGGVASLVASVRRVRRATWSSNLESPPLIRIAGGVGMPHSDLNLKC